ncbi:MAG: transcriptional repressor LexA [Planctomycetota bacterium]|nr:transcriptional repressor LexA [Planctomycetota bacterium]
MNSNTKLATLTSRQRDIYEFLKDKILNRGYGPTVREIGNEFGIRSPNGVMCHLKALEKKGLITREPHMSRAIQLSDKPSRATSVDMLGQLSANTPLTAAKEGEVVDFMDVFGSGDHGCVKVKDESCTADGIWKDDFVIIRKQGSCRDGDRVLALVDGRNAVLRRYFTDPKGVRLEPLTSNKKPITTSAVSVLGVIVGVVRKF